MRRGNSQQRRRGSFGQRRFTTSFCICTSCGYTQQHIAGVPCRDKSCPVCGKPLIRSENRKPGAERVKEKKTYPGSRTKTNNENQNSNKAENGFPVVDTEKCTGCGTCVELCPREAIELKNGVAHILGDNCINCRLCERKCPEGAIH
ncbi:MAG: 4Fe-4S binding protein [Prolixibacteraceae bacterium]|nr:4Fe-4S binding protein [Prolixibacteraceae bacterium]